MLQPDDRPVLPMVLVVESRAVDDEGQIPLVGNMGNRWVPGGRVERGEALLAGAVRDTAEETSLRFVPEGIVSVVQHGKLDRHVNIVTARRRVAGPLRKPQGDSKIDAVRWASATEARELLPGCAGDLAELLAAPAITEVVA